MKHQLDLWQRRWRLWVPALVFFLFNLGFFGAYQLAFVAQYAGLERRLEEREGQLAQEEAHKQDVEELLARAERNREQIAQLYQERFATESERLTATIEEVKSLARRAGLAPQAFTYPEEPIEDFALVERSFLFSVEGTYQQLRTFINFLELSNSFLTLRKVELSEGSAGGASLRIELRLSTLFSAGETALAEVTS